MIVDLVPCPDPDWYWLMCGERFTGTDGKHWMRAEHAPDYPDVDPRTGDEAETEPDA